MLDEPRTIIETSTEMRAFAMVLKAAIGIIVAHWTRANLYTSAHPYRQAARTIESYLERRYHV